MREDQKPSLLKAFAAGAAALVGALAGLPDAKADIVHQVFFEIQPVIVVWGTRPPDRAASLATIGGRNHSEQNIRITPETVYGNGSILAAQPGDLESLDGNNSAAPYFHVASNAAFQIDAQLAAGQSLDLGQMADLRLSLRAQLTSNTGPYFGRNAQWPHSGGPEAGFAATKPALSDLATPKTVFIGNRKTAARRGSIAAQSVRFVVGVSSTANEQLKGRLVPDIVFTVYSL